MTARPPSIIIDSHDIEAIFKNLKTDELEFVGKLPEHQVSENVANSAMMSTEININGVSLGRWKTNFSTLKHML